MQIRGNQEKYSVDVFTRYNYNETKHEVKVALKVEFGMPANTKASTPVAGYLNQNEQR